MVEGFLDLPVEHIEDLINARDQGNKDYAKTDDIRTTLTIVASSEDTPQGRSGARK